MIRIRSLVFSLIVLFFLINAGCKSSSKQTESKDSLWYNENYRINVSHLEKQCDTLYLRSYCDYCMGGNSYYYPHKFSSITCCICSSIDIINEELKRRKDQIKVLVIENSSGIIFKLQLNDQKKLHTLFLFGNDSDKLDTFPDSLMRIKSLRKVILYRVQLSELEIKRMREINSRVEFVHPTLEELER